MKWTESHLVKKLSEDVHYLENENVKVTGATGWLKMRDRTRTAQHCQIVQRVDLHSRAGDI